jgi:membrane-bound lytic murein transglycosylase MltF
MRDGVLVSRWLTPVVLLGVLTSAAAACSQASPSPAPASTSSAGSPGSPGPSALQPAKDDEESLPPVPSPYDALPDFAREVLDTPFTGDLDAMVKRRLIRAGVVFNRTQYFIDKGVQRGMVYESIKLFEEELNKRLKTGKLHVHVAFVPLSRDQLFPALEAGKVDFVAAALTITPERKRVVDFSNPVRRDVSEIVVTAPNVPPVATADDLSGREVFVRRSSSYAESLARLNQDLASRGRPLVTIKDSPEALEDDDILEMVNAGLVDITIVDDFLVDFWRQVFKDVQPQRGAAVRTGGEIGVAVRKNNPRLVRAVNTWIKEYGLRTAFGNTIERRYLENANYVKNAASEADRKRFRALVKLFETYGARYDVDSLLMIAQGYQESRLDQSVKSPVGAIGVMQLMPATGQELKVGDITSVEPNIHAGVKYFRFMIDQYYKDEPMTPLNKGLMTLASYNAGPNKIRQLRREAEKRGLDPNVWFGNVERIASERIGRETVQYVSNIFKYYIAYRLVQEREAAVARAKSQIDTKP